MTEPPILEFRGVSHAFGSRVLFEHLDLVLRRGEHRLLLAPSGSGKSTLINLATGLLTPAAGEVHLCGENLSGAAASRRDDLRRWHIGVVFQTLRLVSALTLRANLRLAQHLAGQPADESVIEALLAATGLSQRAHDKPRHLSLGEMQRGAIARALVAKPALLIADEPTSALDDANAARVARLLLDTASANGSTLLVASHDARLQRYIPAAIQLPARVPAAA